MNTASHFSHSKNFFNFFQILGTFHPSLCRGIYGEIKKFFQKPEPNIIGGINIKTAYKLLKSGAIKSFIIGNKYLIPKINVFEYLELVDNKT